MTQNEKAVVINVVEVVVGFGVGLYLRKKMVDKGMIKGFFTPNFFIRKPGTFNNSK